MCVCVCACVCVGGKPLGQLDVRCPFAHKPSLQRSAHRPPALVPSTNPNERRSRACSPAKAPPTPAGRDPSSRQSSARSPAISRNASPGPRACQCRGPPLEGGHGPIRASRQRTGRPSRRRLGADSRPPRIVRHSPPGGTEAGGAARPSLPVSSGPAAVDAPLRENHAGPRVHCALS